MAAASASRGRQSTAGSSNTPPPGPTTCPRRGRLWAWVGPPLVAALFAAWLAPAPYHLPAVLLLLLAAMGLWCRLRLRAEWEPDPLGRAVNHAWLMLAPHLHAGAYDPADG